MIGYCPLEELVPPVRHEQPVITKKDEVKPEVGLEESECNYVVMAFIVGVIFLAVSDSIRT
jgi:hypothetical protein|tara:strand:- start:575 stop:757 length:183 start_codon:yes stop_codon:yes gene_type:complete